MEPTFSLRDYDEAADYLRSRTPPHTDHRPGAGQRLEWAGRPDSRRGHHPLRRNPPLPGEHRRRPRGATGHRPPCWRDRLRHAGALSLLRGLFPPPDHLAHTGYATAGGDDRDPDQRGRRRQPGLCGGRHHGHHRSSEFCGHDGGQSPARPQPGGVRPALSCRESGLHAPPAHGRCRRRCRPGHSPPVTASTPCWLAPTSSRRPRSACCACWARTPWV